MRLPVVEFGRLLGLKKPVIIGYLYGRLTCQTASWTTPVCSGLTRAVQFGSYVGALKASRWTESSTAGWRRQIIRPELRDIDAFDRVVRVHAAGEQASERI
jgi:hypothetical protein